MNMPQFLLENNRNMSICRGRRRARSRNALIEIPIRTAISGYMPGSGRLTQIHVAQKGWVERRNTRCRSEDPRIALSGHDAGGDLLLGDAESGPHRVLFTRRQPNRRAEDIAGFDTSHVLPLILSKIGKGGRPLLPRVPDDSSSGIIFLRAKGAAQDWIDQLRSAQDIEVGVVGCAGQN